MKKATVVQENSLYATLKALPIGKERMITEAMFPTRSVQTACSQLKKRGFDFKTKSPKDVNAIFVTRLK